MIPDRPPSDASDAEGCYSGQEVEVTVAVQNDDIVADLRKTSIQTDVSTRNTGRVVPHHPEIALPKAAAAQVEDAPGLHTPNEIVERAADHSRVGPLTAEALGLLQQLFIEHKSGTLHVIRMTSMVRTVNHTKGGPAEVTEPHDPVSHLDRSRPATDRSLAEAFADLRELGAFELELPKRADRSNAFAEVLESLSE